MARNTLIKFLRATRSALNTQRTGSGLVAGEPYLITDEGRMAVATATNTYAEALMLTDKQTSVTDKTAGRLMGVGAFGVGTSIVVADANLAVASGKYIVTAGAGNNAPDAGSWDIDVSGDQTNAFTQTAYRLGVAEPLIYVRNRTSGGSGTWNSWRPLLPEYGSNSNGNWIKHANGVMECWGTVAQRAVNITTGGTTSGIFFSPVQSVSFPQTFIAAPSFQIFSNVGNLMWTGGAGAPSTTGASYYLLAASSEASRQSSETWSAFGRWFT